MPASVSGLTDFGRPRRSQADRLLVDGELGANGTRESVRP